MSNQITPENEYKLTLISNFLNNNGLEDFKLHSVRYCKIKNAIRARFKHNLIGQLAGTVTPEFLVRQSMSIEDIMENVIIDTVAFGQFFQRYGQEGK